MAKWYDIRARAGNPAVAEVTIYDEIGMWGISARSFHDDLSALGADISAIEVSINSPGGNVFDGIAIYNMLRAKAAAGVKVSTSVAGVAASIASVIMLAGDTRTMPANAMVMVHAPFTGMVGNADELRDMASDLDKIGASLASTYVARTGQDAAAIAALMSKDTWLSADEALAQGFVTEVSDAVEAKASYDIEQLPESVRKVFASVKKPDEKPEVKPAPAAGVVEDEIAACFTAAGFEAFLPQMLGKELVATVAAAESKVAELLALQATCKHMGAQARFSEFVVSGKSALDARAALWAEQVAASDAANVDTKPELKKEDATKTAGPVVASSKSIWAAHQNQL